MRARICSTLGVPTPRCASVFGVPGKLPTLGPLGPASRHRRHDPTTCAPTPNPHPSLSTSPTQRCRTTARATPAASPNGRTPRTSSPGSGRPPAARRKKGGAKGDNREPKTRVPRPCRMRASSCEAPRSPRCRATWITFSHLKQISIPEACAGMPCEQPASQERPHGKQMIGEDAHKKLPQLVFTRNCEAHVPSQVGRRAENEEA